MTGQVTYTTQVISLIWPLILQSILWNPLTQPYTHTPSMEVKSQSSGVRVKLYEETTHEYLIINCNDHSIHCKMQIWNDISRVLFFVLSVV